MLEVLPSIAKVQASYVTNKVLVLPMANASYTNMLCHVPTMTSVALEVGTGSLISMLPRKSGKSSSQEGGLA